MNDRTSTVHIHVRPRVVIRTLAVVALGISLLLAANSPHTSVESATYAAQVICPGILSSDPEPQIGEIGFIGREAIPESELVKACADATTPFDIGAFLLSLVAVGLLLWAVFVDRDGHIRRRTDDAEATPVRTG